MAAHILPRHLLHHWRPSNGHVPPPGLFEADAGWYRHGMQLQRNAVGVVANWNPLAEAMDDLEQWVDVLLGGSTRAAMRPSGVLRVVPAFIKPNRGSRLIIIACSVRAPVRACAAPDAHRELQDVCALGVGALGQPQRRRAEAAGGVGSPSGGVANRVCDVGPGRCSSNWRCGLSQWWCCESGV